MNTRPTKEAYYLNIAKAVAQRSTCIRRQYGAVIVKHDRIVATGYNGSPRGAENCCDTNVCKREELGCKHGERYELCVAVHAEMNALLQCDANDAEDATLYLYGLENGKTITAKPCMMCSRVIQNMRIKNIVTSEEEKNSDSVSPAKNESEPSHNYYHDLKQFIERRIYLPNNLIWIIKNMDSRRLSELLLRCYRSDSDSESWQFSLPLSSGKIIKMNFYLHFPAAEGFDIPKPSMYWRISGKGGTPFCYELTKKDFEIVQNRIEILTYNCIFNQYSEDDYTAEINDYLRGFDVPEDVEIDYRAKYDLKNKNYIDFAVRNDCYTCYPYFYWEIKKEKTENVITEQDFAHIKEFVNTLEEKGLVRERE